MAEDNVPPIAPISKDEAKRAKLAAAARVYRSANYKKARAAERIREERRKGTKAERRKACRALMSQEEKAALALRQRIWRAEHHDADRAIAKKSYLLHSKERTRAANLKRRQDPQKWIAHMLAARMRRAVRNEYHAGSAVRDLGCSIPEFRIYIETLFQPDMAWNNWGKKGWHLDHIQPLASFDLTGRDQFLMACHYTNYQPLWWLDNLRKGAKSELCYAEHASKRSQVSGQYPLSNLQTLNSI